MTPCGSADKPVTISRIVGTRFGFRWYFVAPHAPLKSGLFERRLRAAQNVTVRRHIPRLTPRQPQPSLRSGRRTLNDISNNRQAGRWDVPKDNCSHRFQRRSRDAPGTAGLRTVVHQHASPARTPPLIAAFRTSAPARTQKRNPMGSITRRHTMSSPPGPCTRPTRRVMALSTSSAPPAHGVRCTPASPTGP